MQETATPKADQKQTGVRAEGSGLLRALASTPGVLFNGAFRTQYGALCFRIAEGSEIEVLVITSRDTGRWVIPKGWPMKNRKPHEAAEIEALQEAGVRGRTGKKPVGQYTYLKRRESGPGVPCIVEIYQVEVTDIETEFKEKGQRKLEWVAPVEAARRVYEPELKSFLSGFTPRGKRFRRT